MYELQFRTSKDTYEKIEYIKKKFKINAFTTVVRWAIAEGLDTMFFIGVKNLPNAFMQEEVKRRQDGGHTYFVQSNQKLQKLLNDLTSQSSFLSKRSELLLLLCSLGIRAILDNEAYFYGEFDSTKISNIYNRDYSWCKENKE